MTGVSHTVGSPKVRGACLERLWTRHTLEDSSVFRNRVRVSASLRLPSPTAPPGSGLPPGSTFGRRQSSSRECRRASRGFWPRCWRTPRQCDRVVRFWGYQAQANVAQRGSSLSVVAVCNRTWAFAPHLDLRSRWRLSFRSLTIPEDARVRASAGGLQPRKLIASMWLQRCTSPAPGRPNSVSQGAGPQVGPGRLALRAAFLGQGALGLATGAPHAAK